MTALELAVLRDALLQDVRGVADIPSFEFGIPVGDKWKTIKRDIHME